MLLLPILLLAVTVAWAAVAMIRDIAPVAARALRQPRFVVRCARQFCDGEG
jgi:hypothetical protein